MTTNSATLLRISDTNWTTHNGNAYSCNICLTKADDVFVATAANLPTVSASGKTESEALDSIRTSLEVAIKNYKGNGGVIPWQDATEPEFGEMMRTLLILT